MHATSIKQAGRLRTQGRPLPQAVLTKTPPGNQAAPSSTMRIVQLLRSSRVLSIQLFAQPFEVRIERHESGRPLKEGPAARIMRYAIQGTLAIAGCQVTPTR